MKDHEKAQLVNELTKVALKYGQTQQLRARIAHVILPALLTIEDSSARELLGEPAAWREHHKGVPDKRTTFTDDPEAVARWDELGSPLEPLYALRHNAESNGGASHPTRTPG